MYEFAPTGYVTLDSDGKILKANLTAAAMLGVERQHLLQANLSKFVNRESQDEFYLHRRAVLSSEAKQTCEVRGHRTNFVSIHRDITERKRAENLLRQERNRAQQYLDVIGVIMVALDSQGISR